MLFSYQQDRKFYAINIADSILSVNIVENSFQRDEP
jgi:hypothetical protein